MPNAVRLLLRLGDAAADADAPPVTTRDALGRANDDNEEEQGGEEPEKDSEDGLTHWAPL